MTKAEARYEAAMAAAREALGAAAEQSALYGDEENEPTAEDFRGLARLWAEVAARWEAAEAANDALHAEMLDEAVALAAPVPTAAFAAPDFSQPPY